MSENDHQKDIIADIARGIDMLGKHVCFRDEPLITVPGGKQETLNREPIQATFFCYGVNKWGQVMINDGIWVRASLLRLAFQPIAANREPEERA